MGTPGSASGLGKRAGSNSGTAPQADSTKPPFGAEVGWSEFKLVVAPFRAAAASR